MEADRGPWPSFTWASIHLVQDILEEGTYWKVGDGFQIKVWTDKWILGTWDHNRVGILIPEEADTDLRVF